MGKSKEEKKGDNMPQEDLGEGLAAAEDGAIIFISKGERDILEESAERAVNLTGYLRGDPLYHRRVDTMRAVVAKYDEANPPESAADAGESRQ